MRRLKERWEIPVEDEEGAGREAEGGEEVGEGERETAYQTGGKLKGRGGCGLERRSSRVRKRVERRSRMR
jgi:hypothetical protein